jgi:hypothetical protein
MTDYLLVMAMMAIALIAVLIAFVLDSDEQPVPDEAETEDHSIGPQAREHSSIPERPERLPDAPEHPG